MYLFLFLRKNQYKWKNTRRIKNKNELPGNYTFYTVNKLLDFSPIQSVYVINLKNGGEFMTIQTHCTDRRAMVTQISEHLHIPAVYLFVPSCAYRIGAIIVNRDASVSADDAADLESIRPLLIEKGYIEADAAPCEDPAPEQEPEEQPEETKAEPDRDVQKTDDDADDSDFEISKLSIGYPCDDKTPGMLRNLIYILYSKQTLLNHSIGHDCLAISDMVIENLKESLPENAEDFASRMNGYAETGDIRGIEFNDRKVFITYSLVYDQDWYYTWLHLIQKIFEAATAATRVFPDHQQPESEKYVMRSWLVRLGMGSPEFKGIRQLLLKNLKGHSAFPSEEAAQKHRDKYAQIRRERREAGEAHAE